MRIDQFLKKTLLLKQRQVAKDLCEKNFVKLNGKYAKPSKHVVVGDVIEIETMKGLNKYRVLMLPQRNVKKNEVDMYYVEMESQH
ncbi:MAG: RNA-binding S4 domain-containing protein [candidate division WOR-3 bacterium]|nr:MAG: RNA-binding S4 domain-containing protein [candidate division WOR-3 bacterium]